MVCCKDKTYQFQEITNKFVPVSTIIDDTVTNSFNYKDRYYLEKCSGKIQ